MITATMSALFLWNGDTTARPPENDFGAAVCRTNTPDLYTAKVKRFGCPEAALPLRGHVKHSSRHSRCTRLETYSGRGQAARVLKPTVGLQVFC